MNIVEMKTVMMIKLICVKIKALKIDKRLKVEILAQTLLIILQIMLIILMIGLIMKREKMITTIEKNM